VDSNALPKSGLSMPPDKSPAQGWLATGFTAGKGRPCCQTYGADRRRSPLLGYWKLNIASLARRVVDALGGFHVIAWLGEEDVSHVGLGIAVV
jgi:hypothetical protein